MAITHKYVQNQATTLAGAGVSAGDSTMTLSSFRQIDGTLLTMTDFGIQGFGTVEPGSGTNEEQIAWTGIVQNGNGTATLTGVTTVRDVYPYTQTANFAQGHAGATTFVVTNTAGYYGTFANKDNDETIAGTWTFNVLTRPVLSVDSDATDDAMLVTYGQLVRTAIAGAVNASTTVQGIVQIATTAAINTSTDIGSTGAYNVVIPSQLTGKLNSIIKFGGTGADGSFVITSGTSTIDLGGASFFLLNYTVFSITGTAQIVFTNPGANGCIVEIRSQGNVTMTSSAVPNIDLSGCGAAGGFGTASGSNGFGIIDILQHGGNGSTCGASSIAGGVQYTLPGLYTDAQYKVQRGIYVAAGSGGGAARNCVGTGQTTPGGAGAGSLYAAGGVGGNSTGGNAAGLSAGGGGAGVGLNAAGTTGGNGGGALYIECAGAFNFTASIWAKGLQGTDGGTGVAGAGGGAGGIVAILYNTLTAASGTIDTSGGRGGNSSSGSGGTAGGSAGGLIAKNLSLS